MHVSCYDVFKLLKTTFLLQQKNLVAKIQPFFCYMKAVAIYLIMLKKILAFYDLCMV
jgi:hypothetical protein